jgi:hypothetical protein
VIASLSKMSSVLRLDADHASADAHRTSASYARVKHKSNNHNVSMEKKKELDRHETRIVQRLVLRCEPDAQKVHASQL